MIRKVLTKILNSLNLKIIVIAPLWPKSEWFTDLLSLLTNHPLKLLEMEKLLKQSQGNVFHMALHCLNLHAWRLSSISSERERLFSEGSIAHG